MARTEESSTALETSANASGRTFVKPNGGSTRPGVRFIKAAKLNEEGVNGVILEGLYKGTVDNPFNDERPDYEFLLDNGETVIINNTGSLQQQMKSITAGAYVQISYSGMKKLESGKMKGKSAHIFDVLVAVD